MDPEWIDDLEDRDFKQWVVQSLRDIHEAARKGLDEAEAIRRAEQLEESILAGRISPREIVLDEEFKDVLYALVYRVLPRSEGNERARKAAVIGKFLEGVRWEDDLLDEKGELIGDCAAMVENPPVPGQLFDAHMSESFLAGPAEPYLVNTGPTSSSTDGEARRFFQKKRAFLDMVFVELHGFTPKEARALKDELLAWFLRFCRREKDWARQPRSLLFAAACHLARQYRSFKAEASETSIEQDERIEALGFIVSVMDNADNLARQRKSELARETKS